jgi:hypothetical protein
MWTICGGKNLCGEDKACPAYTCITGGFCMRFNEWHWQVGWRYCRSAAAAAAVLLCCCAAVLLCCCAAVLLCCCAAVLLCCCAAVSSLAVCRPPGTQ